MGGWKFSVGNLARRAPAAPAPVSPAVEDPIFPLAKLANDEPDDPAAFAWRSDGVYKADLDLNLLLTSSGRTDAPTGWRDLLLYLSDTPGIGPNPPDWGSYAGKTALRAYRVLFQDIEVMPGEDVKVEGSAYSARVRVVDMASQTSHTIVDHAAGSWLDFSESLAADTARTQRATYRVIIEPLASPGYVSDPAVFAEADTVALLGHEMPDGATVKIGSYTLDMKQPSVAFTGTAETTRVWRLDIAMPAGDWPRPIIGEVWIGRAIELLRSPAYPLALAEGDVGQVRIIGARGRVEVVARERARSTTTLSLQFKVPTDAYEQVRDDFLRASLYGAEPVLLLPCDAVEGSDVVYHGRTDPKVSFSRTNANRRTFTIPFTESPFPRLA